MLLLINLSVVIECVVSVRVISCSCELLFLVFHLCGVQCYHISALFSISKCSAVNVITVTSQAY